MFSRLGRLLRRLLAKARITVADLGIRANTHPPQTSAFSLPPETVSLILSRLPPESIVTFALSCRRFHQYMPSPPRLSEEARADAAQLARERHPPPLFVIPVQSAAHLAPRAPRLSAPHPLRRPLQEQRGAP